MRRDDCEEPHAECLREALPASDPAFAILSTLLDVVRASCWAFGTIDPRGTLEPTYGCSRTGNGPAELADELKRQRANSPFGPRIAATLGPLADFTSGVTLVFADARSTFGILMLLRTADLGPFTSGEISVLTFALDAASDQLCAARMRSSREPLPARVPDDALAGTVSASAFYVLDTGLNIVLAWTSDEQRRIVGTGGGTHVAERLPALLEESVRHLTAGWRSDAPNEPGTAHPAPFLTLRTQPMTGPAGFFIGVRIDRLMTPNSLIGAAERYHISPREVQVLALLLDGSHLDQIAAQLHITSSTVQDHIRNMLDKTESRNRSELIGRVLGWAGVESS